ncbi:MAG: MarR family transcriptional regulator [Halioglobus sp.]
MNELDEEIANLIGEIARYWRQRLDHRLRPLGLSQAKWRALLHLSLSPGLSQRELSQRLSIEGPTLVRLLDRLSRDGYIERREDVNDRRCKQVYPTKKSARIIREINAVVVAFRQELFDGMSHRELCAGANMLYKIRERLDQNGN